MEGNIMANCESCPSKGNCSKNENTCEAKNNPNNNIKHVIGVMSGKGGVGKSTIASLIACKLKKEGYKVGILDGDITGPSIPRLFGLEDERAYSTEKGILPVKTKTGIPVMSMNLITQYEEQAVIWRGPMIAGVAKQFFTDVIWGDLDYLLIDMPPGTGDVPLTVMQSMPLSGVVMVSTPQKMVSMIVAKAVNMAEKMNVNVYGVVENMSYVKCSKCGEKNYIFGNGSIEEDIKEIDAKLLGELPLDKKLIELAEQGSIEDYEDKDNLLSGIVDAIKNK